MSHRRPTLALTLEAGDLLAQSLAGADGVGAVGEGGVTVFNAELLHRLGLTEADMERTLARERSEVDRRGSRSQ